MRGDSELVEVTSALILVFHLIEVYRSGNLRSGAGYVWIKRSTYQAYHLLTDQFSERYS